MIFIVNRDFYRIILTKNKEKYCSLLFFSRKMGIEDNFVYSDAVAVGNSTFIYNDRIIEGKYLWLF